MRHNRGLLTAEGAAAVPRALAAFFRKVEGTSDPHLLAGERRLRRARGWRLSRFNMTAGVLVITTRRVFFMPSTPDLWPRLFRRTLEIDAQEIAAARRESTMRCVWSPVLRLEPWELETTDGRKYLFATGDPDGVVDQLRGIAMTPPSGT
jgi:hypothetical protein